MQADKLRKNKLLKGLHVMPWADFAAWKARSPAASEAAAPPGIAAAALAAVGSCTTM